jgi:hypothetical protein
MWQRVAAQLQDSKLLYEALTCTLKHPSTSLESLSICASDASVAEPQSKHPQAAVPDPPPLEESPCSYYVTRLWMLNAKLWELPLTSRALSLNDRWLPWDE